MAKECDSLYNQDASFGQFTCTGISNYDSLIEKTPYRDETMIDRDETI